MPSARAMAHACWPPAPPKHARTWREVSWPRACTTLSILQEIEILLVSVTNNDLTPVSAISSLYKSSVPECVVLSLVLSSDPDGLFKTCAQEWQQLFMTASQRLTHSSTVLLYLTTSNNIYYIHQCLWDKLKIINNKELKINRCFVPFSALTRLGDRNGIRPVKKFSVGLLAMTTWLELCTTYSCSRHHHFHHL